MFKTSGCKFCDQDFATTPSSALLVVESTIEQNCLKSIIFQIPWCSTHFASAFGTSKLFCSTTTPVAQTTYLGIIPLGRANNWKIRTTKHPYKRMFFFHQQSFKNNRNIPIQFHPLRDVYCPLIYSWRICSSTISNGCLT